MTGQRMPIFRLTLIPLLLISNLSHAEDDQYTRLNDVYVTAEKQVKQSLGVSKIDSKDIERKIPVNDISELI